MELGCYLLRPNCWSYLVLRSTALLCGLISRPRRSRDRFLHPFRCCFLTAASRLGRPAFFSVYGQAFVHFSAAARDLWLLTADARRAQPRLATGHTRNTNKKRTANKAYAATKRMIIRTGGSNSTAPRPPSFEDLEDLGPPLSSPRMPTLVIVDAESVGVCANARGTSARACDAWTSSPSRRTPRRRRRFPRRSRPPARGAPLDHVLVTIGLFVGQRGRSLWSPRAAPHVICVTRDLERAATLPRCSCTPTYGARARLSARDRSKGRRQGAARGNGAARASSARCSARAGRRPYGAEGRHGRSRPGRTRGCAPCGKRERRFRDCEAGGGAPEDHQA